MEPQIACKESRVKTQLSIKVVMALMEAPMNSGRTLLINRLLLCKSFNSMKRKLTYWGEKIGTSREKKRKHNPSSVWSKIFFLKKGGMTILQSNTKAKDGQTSCSFPRSKR